MREALFDRSTFWNVNDYIHGSISKDSTISFENIIYATILWDGIIICPEGDSSSGELTETQLPQKMKMTMEILKNNGIRYVDENIEGDYDLILDSLETNNIGCDLHEIRELADVLFYRDLSYALNTDLYLSVPRQEIINRYALSDGKESNRLKPIFIIEKEILDYSRELQEKFGIGGILIETPLLIDYVVDQSQDMLDAFRVAKQISEEKNVIAFRNAMDQLEKCINEKRILEVGKYLKDVKEIVPDLIRKNTSGIKATINLQFNIPFSLGIGVEGLNINLSGHKHRRDIGFLIELAKYGLFRKHKKPLSLEGLSNKAVYIRDKNIFLPEHLKK